MQTGNFQLKWAHASCRGNPAFISEKLILIPFDFTLKVCDLKGKNIRNSDKPGIRIGCATASPELGLIALSEREEKSNIYILNYPNMDTVSKLQRGNNEEYRNLQFTGCEFLVSLSFKMDYEIDLWKWSTGQRLCCVSKPLGGAELPEVNLSLNPLMWSELCIQSNTRIFLLSIKSTDDKYHFKLRSLTFLQNEDDSFQIVSEKLSSSYEGDNSKRLNLVCHCWLPKDNMLIETSRGLLKVNPYFCHATAFNREPESKSVITSMAMSKLGLFVGYKTGFIDIVNISRDHWNIIETIKVGFPIKSLLMSPQYDVLAITTSKGSVSLYELVSLELHEVLRADCAGEIGLCVIEPLSQYCVVAKKTGCLHVFRIANGALMSAIQLDEDITSMASSPLCSLVLIGSNSGFLHFLDVTDPKHPKVVHCVRPYEAPVEHVKFENFGQLFVTYAPDHHVNIWNGLPSSDFEFLGSVKILQQVKDISVFRREKDEGMVLLLLSESGASSEKEAGNILIRLNFPQDFATDPKKYHIDVFKNLCYDALYFQKWRLNYPCLKLDMHVNLGAVFYSPVVKEIQRFPVWKEPLDPTKQISLMKSDKVSTLKISPNQRWISTIDVHGYLQLYSSDHMKLSSTIPKSIFTEIICRHFLGFNVLGNRLLTGSESGYILCYKWVNDLFDSRIIPEWVVYCHSQSEKENSCLRNMEEEESVDLKSCGEFPKTITSLPYEELQLKLQMCMAIVNFRLHKLLEIDDLEYEADFQVSEIILDDKSLCTLSDSNFRNFLLLKGVLVDEHAMSDDSLKNCSLSEIREINSSTLGYHVQNYSAIQHFSRDYTIKHDCFEYKRNPNMNESEINMSFFSKGIKFRAANERFILIEFIRKIIHNWKLEFNKYFDDLYEKKDNIADQISDMSLKMKLESSKLPSKAERDFWNAFLIHVEPEHHPFEAESEPEDSEDSADQIAEKSLAQDSIQTSKRSIESLSASAKVLKLDFNLKVERLFFKRLYCDYIIHFLELKIFCALFFTFIEKEFASVQKEIEKELDLVNSFVQEFDFFLKEARSLEKNLRHLYPRLQRLEKSIESKIETRCNKIEGGEIAYYTFRQLPNFPLKQSSDNPFWKPSLTIAPEDILTEELAKETAPPKNMDAPFWKNIYGKRIRYIKLGIILRHIQYQIMELTKLILHCSEMKSKLEIKHWYCRRILENMKLLFTKLNEKIYILLTVNLENPEFTFNDDLSDRNDFIRFPDLNKLPPVRDEFWKVIRINVKKNQNLQRQLEEVQESMKSFLNLRIELNSKLEKCKVKQKAYLDEVRKDLKDHTNAFSGNKIIIKDLIGDKWNILKVH
ncbi:cilia- and flagella-associated protein 43 [Trichonephila clavipes]|uniref:Cilia- and flagella-associated protein 43 n=1 Tax=Trichonephila clavipes TaxID=2585209 RepID=A0A8X7BLQ8_TRICX|nr:cilia- and flagella-associated protein 43 [Trichonephila clavipes]